jgi:hypothetical protein
VINGEKRVTNRKAAKESNQQLGGQLENNTERNNRTKTRSREIKTRKRTGQGHKRKGDNEKQKQIETNEQGNQTENNE